MEVSVLSLPQLYARTREKSLQLHQVIEIGCYKIFLHKKGCQALKEAIQGSG